MGKRHGFWKLVAAAAVIAVAGGAVHNELLGPRVRSVALPSADPFTLRFAVFNPAFTVTLKNIDMACIPLGVYGNGWMAKAQPFPLNVDIDLGPRAEFEYTCPIASSNVKGPVKRVEAKVAIQYARFGQRRRAMSGTLAWDSASRVWTDAGDSN
ncbi:MAG TPA: hypothetical protein VKB67_09835 [Rhizomicrobium sp.]|nr:hypothetical protein [Rhizomicrobium sp.]